MRSYRTFVDHVWIVRDVATGARLMVAGSSAVVGRPEPFTVRIEPLPRLAWALRRTHMWPDQTKSEIRTLLLCFNRLWRHPELQAAGDHPACAPKAQGQGQAGSAGPHMPGYCPGPGPGFLSMLSGVLCGIHRATLLDHGPASATTAAGPVVAPAPPASGPSVALMLSPGRRPLALGAAAFANAAAAGAVRPSVALPRPGHATAPSSAAGSPCGPSVPAIAAWFTPKARAKAPLHLALGSPAVALPSVMVKQATGGSLRSSSLHASPSPTARSSKAILDDVRSSSPVSAVQDLFGFDLTDIMETVWAA